MSFSTGLDDAEVMLELAEAGEDEALEEAAAEIRRFYNNYHSQRYVDGKLVLRLKHEPSASLVAELNDEFADILEVTVDASKAYVRHRVEATQLEQDVLSKA